MTPLSAFGIWLLVHGSSSVLAAQASLAQAPQGAPAPARPQTPPPQLPGQVERVVLTAGRSTVLRTDFDITRMAVTNPAVADASVVQPREILVDGKAPGTVSLIVWGTASAQALRPRRRAGVTHAAAATARALSR